MGRSILDYIDSEVRAGLRLIKIKLPDGLLVLVSVKVEAHLVRQVVRVDLFGVGPSGSHDGGCDLANSWSRLKARGGMADDVIGQLQIEVSTIVRGGITCPTELDTAASASIRGFVTPIAPSFLEQCTVTPDSRCVGREEPKGEGGGGGDWGTGNGILG